MDICLIKTRDRTQVIPSSIHGMLWLQTHFEENHWQSIANNQVQIGNSDAVAMSHDAQAAGLILNSEPVISSNLRDF
tara:strand:+ start:1469 stop:1699 length:231 start_codon:yes stop_codon:yes gene_type:complete